MMDRRDVATFVLFIDIYLTATPTTTQTESVRFRNTLRLVESGSGDDRSKMLGRTVKLEKGFVARVTRHGCPVERLKGGIFT